MPSHLTLRSMRAAVAGILIAAVGSASQALSQEAPLRPQAGPSAPAVLARLPDDRRTSHKLVLPGRTLDLTATAGAIPIANADGSVLADVGYFAYTLDGADPRSRPVIFAFNGGPGSSSVWLHLGAMGPWRLPLTGATMAAKGSAALVDNSETWLEFADLVFLDPPGTGHSRIAPARPSNPLPGNPNENAARASQDNNLQVARPSRMAGGPEWFWSVRGDLETFAEAITAWLRRSNRQASPVVLAGESYGGFRAPLVAQILGRDHRIGVRAMVLISPVLDFDGRRGGQLPQHYSAVLPSLAATQLERSGTTPTRATLAAVEAYAHGDYLIDLLRGPRDEAALHRIGERVSEMTGVSAEVVRLNHGRLNGRTFIQRSPVLAGKAVSIYDAGAADLFWEPGKERVGDAFTSPLNEPLETAMRNILNRLDWKPARPYILMSHNTNRNWTWRNSPHSPESLSVLQDLLQADSQIRALVVHGFTDLVTPYFATAGQLAMIADRSVAARIALEVYPGGHMLYSRDSSRVALRASAERTISQALLVGNRPATNLQRETP